MKIIRNIWGWGTIGVFLVGTAAHAAGLSGSCTFGTCSAQITQSVLQVTCNAQSVYNGAYELTTDFNTAQIVADTSGGPQISIPEAPMSGSQLKATLLVSGKSTPGTCTFNAS
jgi:hypothetical protein